MAECPSSSGRAHRGVKSQFRLGPYGPSIGFKGAFPVHLKSMDIGQNSQSGISAASDLVSPSRTTRTRTVREYEETISELKKENFDLKLRIFLMGEAVSKNSDKDGSVQVIFQLKLETESLRNELSCKEQLLLDAMETEEKHKSEIKELERKISELHDLVQSLSELPSKEEFGLLLDAKNDLMKQNEILEKALAEKDVEIDLANKKIETLGENNVFLNEKLHKRDLTVQSFVHKHYKDRELIPDEVRLPVIEAVKAAKNRNKEEFSIAMKNITTSLKEISSGAKKFLEISNETDLENVSNPKCLMEYQENSDSPLQLASDSVKDVDNENLLEFVPGESIFLNDLECDIQDNLKSHGLEKQRISHSFNPVLVHKADERRLFWNTSLPEQLSLKDNKLRGSRKAAFNSANALLSEKLILDVNSEQPLHSSPGKETRAFVSDMHSDSNKCKQKATVLPLPLFEFASQEKDMLSISKSDSCIQTDDLLLHEDKSLTCDIQHSKSMNELKETNLLLELKMESKERELSDLKDKLLEVEDDLRAALNKELEPDFIDKMLSVSKSDSCVQTDDLLLHEDKSSTCDIQHSKIIDELKETNLLLQLKMESKENELSYLKDKLLEAQDDSRPSLNKESEPDLIDKISRISKVEACVQTDDLPLHKDKSLTCDIQHSEEVSELKDNILLQLNLESKEKEVSDLKQKLLETQDDLQAALNKESESDFIDTGLTNEKNDLQRRLVHSCVVNVELLKQLKNLEAFMESLLQNSLNSSMDSISEHSEFLSHVSKCLEDSLKLSHELTGQLSILEDSKVCESSMSQLDRDEKSSAEKRFSYMGLNELNISSQDEGNENKNPNIVANYASDSKDKDMIDSGLLLRMGLCLKCWHLVTTFMNKKSYLTHNSEVRLQKFGGYLSSDSDIWSEPDRDISLQRIGIDVKASPVSAKSPRKPNRERRFRHDFGSGTSSYEMSGYKRKRNGRVSCQLFNQEVGKKADSQLEKCFNFIADKESRLKSILQEFENVTDKSSSDKINSLYKEMSAILSSISGTLVKINLAKEKQSSFICGKCAVHELQVELLHFLNQENLKIKSLKTDNKTDILKQFIYEVSLLQNQCENVFAASPHGNRVTESIKSYLEEQIDKIYSETDTVATQVSGINFESLESDKKSLSIMKNENALLMHDIVLLKKELSDCKEKENDLSIKNEELKHDLKKSNSSNFELNSSLKNIEQKLATSNQTLDQLTAELESKRNELSKMHETCLKYEKEVDDLMKSKNDCQNKIGSLESDVQENEKKYLHRVENLSLEKNKLLNTLKSTESKVSNLEKENEFLNNLFTEQSNELSSKVLKCEKLEADNAKLISTCDELQDKIKQSNELIQKLKAKCSEHEESKENKSKEFSNQLEKMEATRNEALLQNTELLKEISKLNSEKETVERKLQEEKDLTRLLSDEKENLVNQLSETQKQIDSLKILNEQLKEAKDKLNKECKSSTSMYDSLTDDLAKLKNNLKNLDSKCEMYEKDLCMLHNIKDNLLSCLLNMKSELYLGICKLKEICRVCEIEYVEKEVEIPEVDTSSLDNECKKICLDVVTQSATLFRLLDTVVGFVKEVCLQNQKLKSIKEQYNLKSMSTETELELLKLEYSHLQSKNEELEKVIQKQKKSILDNKTSNETSSSEIQSLKKKLQTLENESDRYKFQLKLKEDKIAELQENLSDLETRCLSLESILKKSKSHKDGIVEDLIPPQNKNLNSFEQSHLSVRDEASPAGSRESISSNELFPVKLKDGSSHEKCIKKLKSLQTKLAFSEKRIEILENEKTDLQEKLLEEFQGSSNHAVELDLKKKIVDLESKLEKKKCFINELKGDLLKTCNSLIEKEKALDELKSKLSEYETKSNSAILDRNKLPESIESSLRHLTNHKWDLIQAILRMQKEFYNERGIHEKFFDKFKQHIDHLYFLHLPQPIARSKSLPAVGTVPQSLLLCEQNNQHLKSLLSLELDIEYLENIKIFLKRFVFPHLFSNIQDQKSIGSVEREENQRVNRKLFPSNPRSSAEFSGKNVLNSVETSPVSSYNLDEANISNKEVSDLEHLVLCLCHHLECVEKSLYEVGNIEEIYKTSDFSEGENSEWNKMKFLISEMMCEIRRLNKDFSKLFKLNSLLKNMCHLPSQFSVSKQDIYDRESLLSEDIAISRSESPMSSDAAIPLSNSASKSLRRESETLEPKCKAAVKSSYAKGAPLTSSCDSVFHRSHYSSPDLGIESDPNQEGSAPEHKDEDVHKLHHFAQSKKPSKNQPKNVFTTREYIEEYGFKASDNTLYSIGNLSDYELLKREIQECLVGIKSVIMRTGEGLHHVGKCSSPRKALEYDTLKAIKNTCNNLEVCLKQAHKLVGKFWISVCPTEAEWNALVEENQSINDQLLTLKEVIQTQEKEFNDAVGKLKHAQDQKAKIERKISKKLVKTKVVLRQAETKLIENQCQNFLPVPSYPSEQTFPKKVQR